MKKSLVALSLLLCTSVSANNFEEQDISLLSQVGDWSLYQVTDTFSNRSTYHMSSMDTNLSTKVLVTCSDEVEGRMYLEKNYDEEFNISSAIMHAPMVVVVRYNGKKTHHDGKKPNVLVGSDRSAQLFERLVGDTDIMLLSRQVGYIGGNTHVYEYKLSSYGFAESYVSLRKICRGVK